MGPKLSRARHVLLGEHPHALLPLLAPTGLALVLDVVLRGRDFLVFEPHGKAIYFSSLLVSASFWLLPLLVLARFVNARNGPHSTIARAGFTLLLVAGALPVAAASFGGQWIYFRTFHAYAGRDTLRLGALLRGGYGAWFFAWSDGRGLALAMGIGVLVTAFLAIVVSRAAPALAGPFPRLPLIVFIAALGCLWTDNVDSRFLQAATPDACFLNGAFHALRAATTGRGRVRQGVTLRQPTPLPPLTSERARPPNVILIVTESVRADTLCSDPPPACRAQFLDAPDVAADRIPLGTLTSQTPNTFSACMVLWTGLEPNADFADAHRASLLWELAHAVGYRTAYVTSQNAKYEDFGIYVQNAGIDVRRTSTDLGGMAHEQLGAPDERATAEMLRFVHDTPTSTPYFAVLHLSNTHHPYRSDPTLEPFMPQVDDLSQGTGAYLNHYKNSVLWQERVVADFIRDVRALPTWEVTVIVFVSDHAEQFGEHGHVHHNHAVWDIELRVPGWLVAGASALSPDQRAALRTYAGTRTYAQDVNATVVDLFGLAGSRAALPFSNEVLGRSLLRNHDPRRDPTVLLATSTGAWEPDDPWFGVMRRDRVLIGAAKAPWACFNLTTDPGEKNPLPASACPDLVDVGTRAFAPGIGAP